MNVEVHIASLLIHALPDRRTEIERAILAIKGTEIAHNDPEGRMIVTIETLSEADIVQAMTDIQLLTGVVSASLVYHQTDDGLETAAAGI